MKKQVAVIPSSIFKKPRTRKQLLKDLKEETKKQSERCRKEKYQSLTQVTQIIVLKPRKIKEHNYIGVSKSKTVYTRCYNSYQRIQNKYNGQIDAQIRREKLHS